MSGPNASIALDGAGAGAYAVAAMFATLQGDHRRALQLAGRGIEMATTATRSGERCCVEVTGIALWYLGRVAEAWANHQRWETMIDPVEEPFEAAWAALVRQTPAAVVDPPSVAEYVSKARRIAAPLNNAFLTTNIVMATGMVEIAAGRYDAARAQFEHTRELAVQSRDLYTEGMAIRALALLAASTGADDAGTALRNALTHLYTTRNWMYIWGVVEALSLYWHSSDRTEPAAVLLGYLEAHDLRHGFGGGRIGSFAERRQLAIARTRRASCRPDMDGAWRRARPRPTHHLRTRPTRQLGRRMRLVAPWQRGPT